MPLPPVSSVPRSEVGVVVQDFVDNGVDHLSVDREGGADTFRIAPAGDGARSLSRPAAPRAPKRRPAKGGVARKKKKPRR